MAELWSGGATERPSGEGRVSPHLRADILHRHWASIGQRRAVPAGKFCGGGKAEGGGGGWKWVKGRDWRGGGMAWCGPVWCGRSCIGRCGCRRRGAGTTRNDTRRHLARTAVEAGRWSNNERRQVEQCNKTGRASGETRGKAILARVLGAGGPDSQPRTPPRGHIPKSFPRSRPRSSGHLQSRRRRRRRFDSDPSRTTIETHRTIHEMRPLSQGPASSHTLTGPSVRAA